MADRFEVGKALGGMLAGFQPLIDRALGIAGARQMMGQEFWLALDEIGEILLQRRRDPSMQLLPPSAQQHVIGGVLHQRMLESVGGMRSSAAAKQQSCIAELTQRGLQLHLITLRHGLDQFIGKLAAEHRPDLGNILGGRPEPIQASHQ